jgi:signal transduction histidine kinase
MTRPHAAAARPLAALAARLRRPPSLPLRWRLALFYGALAASLLFLLGVVLYRETGDFLVENTAARLRSQARATIERHTQGMIGVGLAPALPGAADRVAGEPVEAMTGEPFEAAAAERVEVVEGSRIVAIPPLAFFQSSPTVTEMAVMIVRELTTRDTSAVVLNASGEIVAGGARLAPAAPPDAPDPPAPPWSTVDVVRARDVPAAPPRIEPLRASPPAPDGARVAEVIATGVESQYVVAGPDGERQLVLLFPLRRLGDRAIVGALQVTTSLQPADDLLGRLRLLLLAGLGGALALSVLVGVPLTRAALRPLDRLVSTTERIAAHDLSARSELPHGDDEIGRLAAAYDRMLERLETSFQAQRQFVADAAHELRTPLTAIGGLIELLLLGVDEEDPAVRRRTLVMVDRDLARLTRLVNDLLALSRHDLAVPHERRRLDLVPLAAEVRALTAELAPDRTVTLERPPGAVEVIGDPDHLRQVLLNLAENARRYTPESSPITFRVRRGRQMAEVAVIDAGPGIPPKDLPRIFDRFYRGGAARDRKSGGSGLGLAIARAIAQAHGGTLIAESAPGEGATFRLRLPLAPATAAARAPSGASSSSL